MVLPTEITLKVEKEDYEREIIADASDVEVKVERKVQSPQIDWSVENTKFFESFQEFNGQQSGVIDYEELTEYGLQICRICKQMFQDIYSLLCHKLVHLELRLMPVNLKHRCHYCLKYFEDKVSLSHHRKHNCRDDVKWDSRKVDSLRQCPICCKVFNYKIWFDHMKQVHSNQYYQCEHCNRKFKAKRYLRNHIKFVHMGKQRISFIKKAIKQGNRNIELFKCDECPAVFPHKTPLHLHIKNCHCEKVRCEKCSSMIKKSYLANHMRRVHYDDGKKHSCDCGKTFKSPRYLKIHIKNVHSKPDVKVRCGKCGSILSMSYLANHMRRVHSDDSKEHKCDCGETFTSSRNLQMHIKKAHSKATTVQEIAKRLDCDLPVLDKHADSCLENITVKNEIVDIKVEFI